jgi:replicative DNA helicase
MRQDTANRTSRYSRAVDRIDHLRDGGADDTLIPLGFPGIDRMLGGGVRIGELVVLAGDVGSGTSSLAMATAIRSALLQASEDASASHTADEVPVAVPRVLFISSELPTDRAHGRLLGIAARVSAEAIRSGALDDISRARVASTALELRDHGPVIERMEPGSAALTGVLDRLRSVQLVVVDGLEAMLDPPGTMRTSRDDALADLILSLKRAALAYDVSIIVVSHLAILRRERADRRPQLADLGARGAIGVHADVVLGLFREEIYESDLAIAGAAEVLLLKHREMPVAYADLYFDAEMLRFEDVMDPEQ